MKLLALHRQRGWSLYGCMVIILILMLLCLDIFVRIYEVLNIRFCPFPRFYNSSMGGSSSSTKTIKKNPIARNFTILWFARQPYFQSTMNFTHCDYSNCKMTDNKSLLNASDAVLFGYRDMFTNVPPKRTGQIWVIVNIESPANDVDLSSVWDNKFDWSMTYRRDSEVLLNYKTFKRKIPLNKNYHEIFKNKSKNISWAVSNCISNSRRQEYVTELKKYIDVDIYGNCGKMRCTTISMPGCHEEITQNYKFYLGFENSLCKDYVSEKVFHTFLDNSNAIYVARSAPNIKSILPPKTFIDVNDFRNPKELADYLIKLGSNESEYVSYLKEIDKYHIDNERNYNRSICDLCELLNTYKTQNLAWTGRNFNKFYRENACVTPKPL